mgnify:CR=1 FL=1
MAERFYCVRQRAGNLVKEYRGTLPPRYAPSDTDEDRRAKADLKAQRRTVLNRDSTDRLELMIALMGKCATHYILEFDDEHLPERFADVRKALRAFLRRVERYRGKGGLDYIPAIEGLHGAHRYHIHLVADYRQLSPAEVRFLWQCGEVTDWPVFKRHGKALGYRYLARYLTKERSDGIIIPVGRHPWSCSRSLRAFQPTRPLRGARAMRSRYRSTRCSHGCGPAAVNLAATGWRAGSRRKESRARVRATLLVTYWLFSDRMKGWR